LTGGDSSDVMDGGNLSDIVAVWGFLVESPLDGNWSESRQTTDSGVAAGGESDVVWTPGVVFRVTTISVLMLLTLIGNLGNDTT